jgi:membrane associated rhomboid family serine protease
MIPVGTDYRMRIKPWVNYALVAVNVGLFFTSFNGMNPKIQELLLDPDMPQIGQFFSSMFLHADLGHLIGNMIFLWVFGNVLNDRLGHLSYLLFYIAGGIVAGLGYLVLTPDAPVLGASGAISAVAGAFLVLFPAVRVKLWFYFIEFEISSLLFLGLEVAMNLSNSWSDIRGSGLGGVAYVAHSSGHLFGIAVASVLLLLRLLPREGHDLIYLVSHARKRWQYRRMTATGNDPFGPNRLKRDAAGSRHINAQTVAAEGRNDTESGQELQLRRDIAAAVSRGDLPGAAALYREILKINGDIVLPRQQQLDIANHLMADEAYAESAEAYERFLRHFRTYEHIGDIELMLGLVYGRYLSRLDEAERLLSSAAAKLTDATNKHLAESELAIVRRKRGEP